MSAPKRGPGRPRVNPGSETVALTIRFGEPQHLELRRIVESGHGPHLADAVRHLVDDSAARRLRRTAAGKR